jgi:DAPG hydrolase PhiG domain
MTIDFARLLDPAPLAFEMGYRRWQSGVLHIAVRTDMHRCTGAMFNWWFGSRPGTREYRWWHPIDHLSSDWIGGALGDAVGATHVVEEALTDVPPIKLNIQFRDPAEAFSAEAIRTACGSGAVSALLWGHVAPTDGLRHTPDGKIIGSRLIHIARDIEWGMVLRSHFLMGFDLPAAGLSPQAVVEAVPDPLGPGLLQHCYDEFTILSRLLPSIYLAEATPPHAVKRPW